MHQNTFPKGITGRFLWYGIGLGFLFWILETGIHVFIFHKPDLLKELINPDAHEVWMRLLASCLFIFFGVYVQYSTNQRKRAQQDLQEAHDELERRVEERTSELQKLNEQLKNEVAERKQAESETRQLKQKMEFILGATNTGINIIDSDHNVLFMDAAWQESYGNPSGRKCYEYFMGKSSPCGECGVAKALETREVTVTEECLVKEDDRPIQVTSIPYKDENGEWLVAEVKVDISERKQLEENLSREAAVNAGMAELATRILGARSIDHITDIALEQASKLTDSKIGFVGYIEPETGHLVSPTMTRDVWDVCSVPDKDYVFKKFSGLWGWVLNNKKPLLSNDPGNDPRMSGIPEGHPPIERFLSVPAVHGDAVVGQISLANADRDYTEQDLLAVQRLAAILALGITRKQAEEALRVSENKLDGIINSITDHMSMMDKEHNIVWANQVAKKLFGEDVIGKKCYTAYHGRDSVCPNCIVSKTFADGKTHEHETRVVGADGNEMDFWCTANVASWNEDGTPGLVVEVSRNITDRVNAEQALKESEAKLEGIVSAVTDHMCMMDEDYNLVWANDIAKFQFGGDIVGKKCFRIFHGRQSPCPDCATRKTFEDGKIHEHEGEAIMEDGTRRYFWITSNVASWHEDGRPKTVVEISRDITERKLAEQSIIESEQRFRRMLENVPNVAVQGYGPDGTVHYWNKANESLYGYTEDEALGRNLVDLIIPPEMRDYVRAAIKHGAGTGEMPPAGELELMHKDGSYVPVFSSHVAVQKPNADPELFCIDIDLRDRKRMEEELIRAKIQAEDANKAKSMFLANMSHEIRTPISAIMGMIDMLLDTRLRREQHDKLKTVRDSAKTLLAIINDILDISRIEVGKLVIEPEVFDLHENLQRNVDLFKDQAKAKDLKLNLDISPEVPRYVNGDPDRLGQVVMNLVGNAIKFTEKGSVDLEIKYADDPQKPNCYLFVVRDTGIGIPESETDKLFQVFGQVDSTYSKQFQGTGLGLAISKRLVEMMGGRIWAESKEGKGSSFYFTVAFEDLGVADREDYHVQEEFRLHSEIPPQKILLAEDNLPNQEALEYFLKKAGHTVVSVTNGQKALETLEQGDFDLVLMDVQMPVMDGLEATRKIRDSKSESLDPKIPIIAMTAYAMKGEREIFLNAGMDDYVSKPVDLEELFKVMTRVATIKPTPAKAKQAPVDNSETIDMDKLKSRYGSRELLTRTLSAIIDETPDKLKALGRALESEDLDMTARMSRNLLNSFRLIHAGKSITFAKELEAAATGDNIEKAKNIFAALTEETDRVLRSLSSEFGLGQV